MAAVVLLTMAITLNRELSRNTEIFKSSADVIKISTAIELMTKALFGYEIGTVRETPKNGMSRFRETRFSYCAICSSFGEWG